jgi:hypothetical protein
MGSTKFHKTVQIFVKAFWKTETVALNSVLNNCLNKIWLSHETDDALPEKYFYYSKPVTIQFFYSRYNKYLHIVTKQVSIHQASSDQRIRWV